MKPQKNPIRILGAILLLLAMGHPQAHAYTHPCVPTTREELDTIKASLNREPWKSGYAALAAHLWFPPSQGHLDHQRSGYPTMDLLEQRRPTMATQPGSVMR